MLPRHAEQRVVFDVEGLRRLAAQSVGRSPDDIVNTSNLTECGLNCTFLITLRDDFQLVARFPYPAVPNHYAVGGKVATMDFRDHPYILLDQIALPSPPPLSYCRSNVRRSHALV